MTDGVHGHENPSDPRGIVIELAKAASELAQYASYAEIVGGVSENRSAIRMWSDRVFELKHALEKSLDDGGTPLVDARDVVMIDPIERFETYFQPPTGN